MTTLSSQTYYDKSTKKVKRSNILDAKKETEALPDLGFFFVFNYFRNILPAIQKNH